MDIKQLPWDEVLGKVEDLIAGLVGLESAGYGKEVSGKKSNTRIMNMVMALTTTVIRKKMTSRGLYWFWEWCDHIDHFDKRNNHIHFHFILGSYYKKMSM